MKSSSDTDKGFTIACARLGVDRGVLAAATAGFTTGAFGVTVFTATGVGTAGVCTAWLLGDGFTKSAKAFDLWRQKGELIEGEYKVLDKAY